jgi:hypothetical protein
MAKKPGLVSLLFLLPRPAAYGGSKMEAMMVKYRMDGQSVERKKVVAIGMLFMVSSAIILSGLAFSAYSAMNRIEFMVMNARVPGVVFGVVVAFLGMRYVLSVQKLKREVYKSDSRFSWSNFRKKK